MSPIGEYADVLRDPTETIARDVVFACDPARLATVRRTGLRDAGLQESLQRYTRLAALGANVPLGALRDFVAEHQPAVTGLGFNVETDLSYLLDALRAVHEVSREPRIMLVGRSVPQSLRGAGYPFVRSSLEALPAIQTLLDSGPQTLPPSVAP